MTDFDPKSDWPPPTEAESETVRAIREYFDRGSDRAHEAPSPLFTGRDRLVNGVREDLRRLRASRSPLRNLTWALHGGPGAGKSEVLLHLAAEFSRWDEGDSPVLVVWGGKAILTEPVALGEAIYEAGKLDPDKLTVELVRMEYGGSVKVAHATATIERRARRSATAVGRVARAINRECGDPTIVLLVDEAQKALEGMGDSDLPNLLHQGIAGLKVLPVYGGLGDTLNRLADAGVSRLGVGHAQQMKPLPERVAGDMCITALSTLTDPPDKASVDRWAVEIVKRCDGWPMHLTHCLLAARERRRAASGRSFTDEDFHAAMGRADRLRHDYYDLILERCPALDSDHYEAWGRLFADGSDANPAEVARALALSKAEAKALLDKAVRAGLVERTKPHLYASPIPSLARHTVEVGRAHARRAAGG